MKYDIYRIQVLNLHIFKICNKQEINGKWLKIYNIKRPHETINDLIKVE